MKSEMKTKALRFLSDIQTGPFGSQLHKEDYVDDGTPIVTVEHLGNRVFTEQNLPRVSNEDKQRLSKYILKEGDIVFSRVGSVDRCSFVDSQHTGWLFSGRCLRVRPFEEISPLFLYYFFCLESTKKFIRNIAVGATMPSINTKLMGEIEVSYPDKQVQEKIANLLGAIDNKIELNNAINDNLEAQAEAIYNEMIANNSTNGTMSTLGEISTIKTGKLNSEAAVINGIYPFFTCSQETYRTNTFSFDQEAVLLAGNNASAIYPLKIYCGKFDVYQRTYVISSNNRFVSNKQLYFVLKQQLNEFKGISSGTTTKFLTMKILTPIPVVIAPEDIATSFINITNKIFETIFQNQREIEHLRELQMIVLGELSRD